MEVFTIGHSTRPTEAFIELLKNNGIAQLVDVRTIPKSRHNPQYEQHSLEKNLSDADIKYVYMKDLGGLRHSTKDSQNMGWQNKSFRNYADYMQTQEFADALEELIEKSQKYTTAIMCAEAVPWRCHRSLIGDALVVRNIVVKDIISQTDPKNHTLTSFAKTNGKKITYPKLKD